MSRAVIVDTGPLVAMLDRGDQHNAWATHQLHGLREPLLTSEPVITEACHLVRHLPGGREAVIGLLRRGVVSVEFHLQEERDRVAELLRKYSSVPMSLADATLVRLTELRSDCVVFTIDGDFRVYRRNGKQTIPLLVPPGV